MIKLFTHPFFKSQTPWIIVFMIVVCLIALYTMIYIQHIEKTIQSHHTHLNNIDRSLALLNEADAGVQTQLSKFIYQMSTVSHSSQWIIEQAKYYLELARVESQYPNHMSTCLISLNHAEYLLNTLKDPTLTPVVTSIQEAKRIIVQEIPALTKMFEQYYQLQNTINQYKMQALTPKIIAPKQELLKKLVVIHQSSHADTSTATKETTVLNHIHFYLQEARLALLLNDKALFDLANKETIKNIPIAFMNNPDLKKQLTTSLQTLSQFKFPTPPASLQTAIDALNQHIQHHMIVPPDDGTPP